MGLTAKRSEPPSANGRTARDGTGGVGTRKGVMYMEFSVGMVSLGCPKNQMDAELMMAKLQAAGIAIKADAALVSRDPALETVMNNCDLEKEQAVALSSRMDEDDMPCFFRMHRSEETGKVDLITHVRARDYVWIPDYYEEWNPCGAAGGGETNE